MLAAQAGKAKICTMLIYAGCGVNRTNKYNKTALCIAAKHGFEDVVM